MEVQRCYHIENSWMQECCPVIDCPSQIGGLLYTHTCMHRACGLWISEGVLIRDLADKAVMGYLLIYFVSEVPVRAVESYFRRS
jgi:hypothetical protein